MSWLDWLIVIIPLGIVIFIGYKSRKYVHGVSDFLAAGRVAGRYVVAVANGEAALGLISLIAIFEMYYKCGFAIKFWAQINIPLGMMLALTGYCIYRFRETKAMTMGQFQEIRYSKIFPGFRSDTTGHFRRSKLCHFPCGQRQIFLYIYCDLPLSVNIFGLEFPMFALVMMLFLGIAVLIVTFGGQVTIMVTDCVQGIISYPMYAIIVAFILYKFSWFNEMAPTLLDRPVGEKHVEPI